MRSTGRNPAYRMVISRHPFPSTHTDNAIYVRIPLWRSAEVHTYILHTYTDFVEQKIQFNGFINGTACTLVRAANRNLWC